MLCFLNVLLFLYLAFFCLFILLFWSFILRLDFWLGTMLFLSLLLYFRLEYDKISFKFNRIHTTDTFLYFIILTANNPYSRMLQILIFLLYILRFLFIDVFADDYFLFFYWTFLEIFVGKFNIFYKFFMRLYLSLCIDWHIIVFLLIILHLPSNNSVLELPLILYINLHYARDPINKNPRHFNMIPIIVSEKLNFIPKLGISVESFEILLMRIEVDLIFQSDPTGIVITLY